jgi:HEAT repeat protein
MSAEVGLAAGLGMALCVAILLGGRAVASRRRAGLEASVRPILFRAIDGGDVDLSTISALDGPRQRAVESQARSLLPKLRGEEREALARLLEERGVVDAARRQSHSRRPTARAKATDLLGQAGSPAAVRDLVPLLRDPDPQVRWSAARGLGTIGHVSALPPLLASLEGTRPLPVDVVADAVTQIRESPVPLLRQALRSRSGPMRAVAVELLGRFQALASAGDLIRVLREDESLEVRARTARALGRLGSPRAVTALLTALEREAMAVRAQTVWALGQIGDAQAVPALRGVLVGASKQLSELAAAALAAMGSSGLAALAQVADGDGPPQASEIAAAALAGAAFTSVSAP